MGYSRRAAHDRVCSDGHFLITSPDSIPLWAPLVGPFLDKHG